MNKFVKNVALYVFIIVIAVAIFNTFVHPQEKFTEMAYSDFVAQIEKKNVSSVIMVEIQLKENSKMERNFYYIPNNDTQIVKKMTDGDVVITVKPPEQPSWWMSLLSSLLPILILWAFGSGL